MRLQATFGGAGVLAGDLTPECAAVIGTVLDALSAPAGAGDTRSHEQRYHDALAEAMRRLVAAGLVPDRAGQPARVVAHVSLADLLELDADSVLLGEWVARVRAQWAGARAAASVTPGDGGAWLDGAAAGRVRLRRRDHAGGDRRHQHRGAGGPGPAVRGTGRPRPRPRRSRPRRRRDHRLRPRDHRAWRDRRGRRDHRAGRDRRRGRDRGQDGTTGEEDTAGPVPPTGRGREALEKAVIGKAVELLSGPGGLASFLRRRQLGARLGGPSLPLDVGYSENVPAGIRHAVLLRDQHCRWAGGCLQPAAACEIHHVRHKSRGGKTSVKDCVLLCWFHHHVVIHRWGWTLVLHPDGTTTAWNPDRSKVLHSHGPPARAG